MLILPGCQQCALVDEVLQIRAGEARSALSQLTEAHVLRKGFPLGVDLQDLLPALDVRQTYIHLPVKPSGPQQCGVQHIRPVGGGQDHHALVGGKAVHLYQKLVQGLLTFVMTAAQTGAALTAHGVDLVNEHNGGGLLFRLLKQVPDTAGAYAHIQFHKVGTGNGQEAHAGLAGHRLGKQRLAGAWRAHQQHALGDSGAQIDILLWIF